MAFEFILQVFLFDPQFISCLPRFLLLHVHLIYLLLQVGQFYAVLLLVLLLEKGLLEDALQLLRQSVSFSGKIVFLLLQVVK